ncbi:MAG: cation transporter [Negativicutes bacterium]|nr:cation transporter [Negativicutes bacterium]
MCKTCGCHGGKLEKQVIPVKGMTCGHCKGAVEKAARGLPGVMAAEVDLAGGTLKIEYDPAKTPLDTVKKAVEEAGFEVA